MNSNPIASPLQDDIVAEVSAIVTELTGVQLGPKQRPMINSRIHRRMSALGLRSQTDYLSHLRTNRAEEAKALVSLLTTHHTYFFREYGHFEFLAQGALSGIVENARRRGQKKIKVWCAACSRGQEVYSLAMFLNQQLALGAPDMDYEILGTDVDPESVTHARNGVYPWNDVKGIPSTYLSGNWARGKGDIERFAKVKPDIKAHCRFEVLNLIHPESVPPGENFDLIFCRNVFIYFSPSQIKSSASTLLKRLAEGGYFFIGMTESLTGLGLPISTVGPSVYQNEAKGMAKVISIRPTESARATLRRVLCVDDSPIILTMLKKILLPENGFSVVGTAKNGKEAAEWLKTNEVELMTLDLHMPEMGGIEYLSQHFKAGSHPPVVVISSVQRENASLALRALELGASDYIEKPELGTLGQNGDEIRAKLSQAARSRSKTVDLKLEKAFSSKLARDPSPSDRQLICASLSDLGKLFERLNEMKAHSQPPTVIAFEGIREILPEIASKLQVRAPSFSVKAVSSLEELRNPSSGSILVCDLKTALDSILPDSQVRRLGVFVYGEISGGAAEKIRQRAPTHLFLEESQAEPTASRRTLIGKAKDIVPATSFDYLADQLFRE